MLIRISLAAVAVALGITVAGAHQAYKADHKQLNLVVAEKLLSSYQGSAIPTVFPDSSKGGQDADSIKLALPHMGHCHHCHF
jgi:hypothetical protein